MSYRGGFVFLAAVSALLAGCQQQARVASDVTGLASVATVYAAERYQLPPLAQIDRVVMEVRKKTWIPAKLYDPRVAPAGSDGAVERLVSTRTSTEDAAALVESINDPNRWWQNPALNFAPVAYRRDAPPKPKILFLSKDAVVRELVIDGDYFVTTLNSRTIRREISTAEAKLLARYAEANREGASP